MEWNRLSILLADSHPTDLEWLAVREQAVGVHLARSIEAAKDCLQKKIFNLIFWDLRLADCDRLSLFDELRSLAPQTPIYVLCGEQERETALELMGKGLSGHFYREQLCGIIDLAIIGFEHLAEEKSRQLEIASAHTTAAVSMLAGGVVHGVNNPLTYLLYNLECLTVDVPNLIESFTHKLSVLEEHLGREKMQQILNLAPGQRADRPEGFDFDEIADCLNDALIGGQRVREISSGLAILSRIGDGKLTAVKISDVIDSIIKILYSQIRRRATLIQEIDQNSRVLANEGVLAQAFLGLIETMVLDIGKGDVENNELKIRAWREGEAVYVEISHTRKAEKDGHSEKTRGVLGGTSFEGQTLGFGLLVTKKIVEGYGGTLTENSNQKKRQCFLLCLPRSGGSGKN